jgi:hypothetical protein
MCGRCNHESWHECEAALLADPLERHWIGTQS